MPAPLVVSVAARSRVERAREDQRRGRDDCPARVQPLADHVHVGHALLSLHVLGTVDVGVAVEQRGLGQPHLRERDPGVVEIIADCLVAHVLRRDTRHERAVLLPEVHKEGVGPVRFALHQEVRNHHGQVRGEPLGDPVLLGPIVGAVEEELLPPLVIDGRRVHHEAAVHACEALRQAEAAELALLLELVEERHLLRVAQGDDRASEEVELHREADAKARAYLGSKLGEQAMGHEEAFWLIAKVRELQRALAHQLS
mmetsp:Transcript_44826/g.116040  ORF Transcript_44826/g.116040 Transcript_44826/m.116040 type:complete len:256 (-) Transcript_44826:195-962(-)